MNPPNAVSTVVGTPGTGLSFLLPTPAQKWPGPVACPFLDDATPPMPRQLPSR